MNILIITSIVLFIAGVVKPQTNQLQKCSDITIQNLCIDRETCDECLQADPCCNWCYDENYAGRKCNIISSLGGCNMTKAEFNSDSGYEIPKNGDKQFTDGEADEVIQIRPQLIDIKLGRGRPVNFTFTYKPAKNYPLDLYFLGDLSFSMQKHISIFKTLGTELPNSLAQLTKNYRLAYGSFMDKIGMPFYLTGPTYFDNPCLLIEETDCEKGYLFKHRLSFSKDTVRFAEEVSSSKVTANIDLLDGALDAILQILVCDKKMGWSVYSRKIILLPTDSLLHTAGDGLLVGAVLQPNGTCLMDDDGNHMSPLVYDYPSVGQIDALLKEKKVNIIFGVYDIVTYYKDLTDELLKDSSFVGALKNDSSSMFQLITEGFHHFARQVSFSINTASSENLDVKFFADCKGRGIFNETSACYNVEEQAVKFTVQLTLKGPPTKRRDLLYIEEKNINEKIALNITYLGLCECKNYGEQLQCANGKFRCDQCMCDKGWTGTLCDESCDEDDNFNSCRSSSDGTLRHRNGDCVCSGLAQGKCIEGKCKCKTDFSGEDCSCSKSTSNCKLFEAMSVCSRNGECVCNKCKCLGGFSGQYCELNKGALCDDYKDFVENAVANGIHSAIKDDRTVSVEEINEEERNKICGGTCTTVAYVGNSFCTIKFCFHFFQDGVIHLVATPNCVGFRMLLPGLAAFGAIIFVGLLIIGSIKYRIYMADCGQSENDRENHIELEPVIFVNPLQRGNRYRNPMQRDNHFELDSDYEEPITNPMRIENHIELDPAYEEPISFINPMRRENQIESDSTYDEPIKYITSMR